MEITPQEMDFPHVVQLARLDRIRELRDGRQQVETVWLITSLSSAEATAERLMELARQYWSIENGTHLRLDVAVRGLRLTIRELLDVPTLEVEFKKEK